MKVKKAAKRAMESAIWGVAERLRLRNGGWENHDEWVREAAIEVADALVSLVFPAGEHKGPSVGDPPGEAVGKDPIEMANWGRAVALAGNSIAAADPLPPGAQWDGDDVVLREGGRVSTHGGGSVLIKHKGRSDIFDDEDFIAAGAALAHRPSRHERRPLCEST